eukprot:TRINITY_DN9533_c0_g1_i7.p1 TRINITY_DN9533_c0_g1~~TRINITY_DN9533_c0_g1_i7.p1  ORF type:complete len:367 (+),score=105.68 TRINITY_DN9533_c0_g1_i7:102-1202(+)
MKDVEGHPLLPYQQLLAVMPPESFMCLPRFLQPLVIEPTSPLSSMYHNPFHLDMNGCRFIWKAQVILDFFDYDEIIPIYNSFVKDNLTEQDRKRNTFQPVPTLLYNSKYTFGTLDKNKVLVGKRHGLHGQLLSIDNNLNQQKISSAFLCPPSLPTSLDEMYPLWFPSKPRPPQDPQSESEWINYQKSKQQIQSQASSTSQNTGKKPSQQPSKQQQAKGKQQQHQKQQQQQHQLWGGKGQSILQSEISTPSTITHDVPFHLPPKPAFIPHQPTTKILVRLYSGKSVPLVMNKNHTIKDLKNLVIHELLDTQHNTLEDGKNKKEIFKKISQLELEMVQPHKVLVQDWDDKTLEEVGILNVVVRQNWKS